MRLKATLLGAFIGFLLGAGLYMAAWLAKYVANMPWWVAALLNLLDLWLLGKIKVTASIWTIVIPTIIGGVVGFLISKD